jgi:hypothetical protein
MNTYYVTIKYTVETTYTIDAEHEEDAEMQAWIELERDPDHAMSYGDWSLASIEKSEEDEIKDITA